MPNVLTQKSYIQYQKLSRYNNIPYYYHKLDNKYVYATGYNLDINTPFITTIVQKNDTLDSLALQYYNNPTYFWIIADFNRINDPYTQLIEGTTIKIPSFSAIRFTNT